MKVIKRDGRIVSYDRQKIVAAIENANNDVCVGEQASTENIKSILAYIEDMNKNRILVEDIQDIVEEKLIEFNKCELANKYKMFKGTSDGTESNDSMVRIMVNANESPILTKVAEPVLM